MTRILNSQILMEKASRIKNFLLMPRAEVSRSVALELLNSSQAQ